MKLFFIRHGETKENVAGLTHKAGSKIGLNENGRKQIHLLIPVCRMNKITMIYSSPEKRAIETATIISENLKLEHKILPNLAERNWGDWDGRSWDSISQVLDKMTIDERYQFIPPNGESWQQMEKRLHNSLSIITSELVTTPAIVTHGGALRGLMSLLQNQDKSTSLKYNFDNASISTFDFKDGRYTALEINNTNHLK